MIITITQAPAKRPRQQLGRRDSDEQVDRAIKNHFSHLPSEVVETARVDGLLARDKIRLDRQGLAPGTRLGASYWVDLAGKVGRGCQQLDACMPTNKDPSTAIKPLP